MNRQKKPWYREPWLWFLMSGPVTVVIAAFVTLYLASSGSSDLVTDDYYKDGKHINMDVKRDTAARERKIRAQVLISPNNQAIKAFIDGKLDKDVPLKLLFMHPVRKDFDQVVLLQPSQGNSRSYDFDGKTEFTGRLEKPLSQAKHWYIRLEDGQNNWKIESKWVVKNRLTIQLQPSYK